MFDDLNDDTFLLYAAKAYTAPHYIIKEFEADLKKIKYLKRLFRKYYNTGNIKDRLVLNHLILLYNMFGIEAATRILFFKLDERDYSTLKTFLLFLNFMPNKIEGIRGKTIISSDIPVDLTIANVLRNL